MKIHSIKNRFIIAFSLVCSFLYGILISIILASVLLNVMNTFVKNSEAFAKLTIGEIKESFNLYFKSEPLRFKEKMQRIASSLPDISRIAIVDTNNMIIFSTSQLKGFTIEDTITQISLNRIKRFEPSLIKDGEYIYAVPVLDELGRFVYTVTYYFSKERINFLRRQIILMGILVHLLLTFSTVLIINRITSNLIKGISELKKVADSVKKGDYSVRSKVSTKDEIMDLSEAMNSMLESINGYIYNLKAMVEELNARDKSKNEILANISHELRTPITASKGYIELLFNGKMGKLSDEQKRALEIVNRNLDRLEKETRKLLEGAKAALDNVKLKYEKVNLKVLVDHVLENFMTEIERKQIRLIKDIEVEEFYTNYDQIFSIFENLVSNAVKFVPEAGEIEIKISKETYVNDEKLKLSVFNSGPPINDSKKERIFEPFYQLEEGTRKSKGGVGLGLYIVKRAVAILGGTISVENRNNTGVEFTVFLPYKTINS